MASFDEVVETTGNEDEEIEDDKNSSSMLDALSSSSSSSSSSQLDQFSIMKVMKQGKKYIDKFEKQSEKIQESMVQNAKFMKKEVENDFINRTMQASEKVIGNFGKTLNRMEKVAYDIYKMWNGDGSGGSSGR
eukprot:377792_1